MGVDVGIAGSIGLDGLRIDEKNESESERQKVSGSIIRYYQLMIGVRVVVIGAPILLVVVRGTTAIALPQAPPKLSSFPPRQRGVRSVLSPRCVRAAARSSCLLAIREDLIFDLQASRAGENPKPERVFSERSEETLSCPPQALKFLR